jgi:hypothetical protein
MERAIGAISSAHAGVHHAPSVIAPFTQLQQSQAGERTLFRGSRAADLGGGPASFLGHKQILPNISGWRFVRREVALSRCRHGEQKLNPPAK